MIKKLELSNLYIIIVFIVGVFDIIYGVSFELQQYKNKRESIKTDAYIYAVVTREDKKKILYVNYDINNKTYDNILLTNDKYKKIGSNITIFYNKKNPTKITDGTISKNGYFIIVIGFICCVLGCSIFCFSFINRHILNHSIFENNLS